MAVGPTTAGAENVQRLVTLCLTDTDLVGPELAALPADPAELRSTINTAVGVITGLLQANCTMRGADPQASWAQFCAVRTAQREAEQ